MSDKQLTAEDVKAILAKNGVESLDQLANMIASSSADKGLAPDLAPLAASWVIKVWKISDKVAGDLPDHLGGSILKEKLGTKTNIGG